MRKFELCHEALIIQMKKESSLKKLPKKNHTSIELFDTTGAVISVQIHPILFSKITTMDGINTWVLLHQN